MFAAAREIGIPKNEDYNGEFQDGVAMTQATISRGKRQSTAVAYLNPARNRRNLTILTDSLCHQANSKRQKMHRH
jgi:choline dehydrogenase